MAEHVTAAQYVDYVCRRQGIAVADLGVAPTVVGTWSLAMARHLAEQAGAVRQERYQFYGDEAPLWTGVLGGNRVSFTRWYVGAPATIMQMEELIACGARRFVGLGWAGSLRTEAPVGSFLIPSACIAEEGTSAHYPAADGAPDLGPDPDLAAALAAGLQAGGHAGQQGLQWTTDAIFRELRHKVAAYAARGAWGVDMETSAMFALGRWRRVAVANLLVVSDELWHEWRPAFGSEPLRQANRSAATALLHSLENLRPD